MNVICQERLQGFHYIWHKHPLGLSDELIRIRWWWSKVKITVTLQSTLRNRRGIVNIFPIWLYTELVTLILRVRLESVVNVQILCYQTEKCSLQIFYESGIVWLVEANMSLKD